MQVQVLWTGRDEELDAKEIALIRDHGTLAPHGYNALPGGDVNPMSVQSARDSVKDSWADPEVRERHRQGRVNAWQDPIKRANQMKARERAREAKIATYPPEEQDAVRERLRRQRETQQRYQERKRLTSSASTQRKSVSSGGGTSKDVQGADRDPVHLEALGVLADGAVSKEGQAEQKDSCTSSSDACSPNERMVGGDQAEATRGNLVNALCESDAESVDWF